MTNTAEKFFPNLEPRGKVYDSILDTIGATPLVNLGKFAAHNELKATILAKLEFFNPMASIKDRAAYAMIEDAERAGRIKPGVTTIIEPTSGNTGIGLALICAAKGYKLILTMPETMSMERRKILRFMGAELILTTAEFGMKGAIERANELAKQHENSFIPGQFDNQANVRAHRETTAFEIWTDTCGNVDALVAGVGTGGTITGVSQIIKQHKPDFKSFAVEPSESPVLSDGVPAPHKIQGIGAGFVPEILDKNVIDEIVQISSARAFEIAREAARIEGIPCGISSGAALAASIEVARKPEMEGKTIVVIIPSFAERYLSTDLFEGMGT